MNWRGLRAILWFQTCFIVLLLGAGSSWEPWICAAVLASLLWQYRRQHPARAALLMGLSTLLAGPWVDFSLARAGLVTYQSWWDLPVPLWIISLWICFGHAQASCFNWLTVHGRWWSWLCIALGAPLAYLAGQRLGAASIEAPLALSLSAISFGWLLVFLVLKITAHAPLWASKFLASGHSS